MTSVVSDGRDLGERSLTVDAAQDMADIVVTFSDRGATLTGIVKDNQGAATSAAFVALFPVNRDLWRHYGTASPRIRSTQPASNGVYSFEHVPPGDYFVRAVEQLDLSNLQAPAFLESVALGASRATLARGENRTLDLARVKGR